MLTELTPLSSLLLFTYTPLQADRFAKVTNFFDNVQNNDVPLHP